MQNDTYANDTYINIISSIAVSAASQVAGVASVTYESGLVNNQAFNKKKKINAINVIVKNNMVSMDISINVYYGKIIPLIVCDLQEKVKKDIENATCYKVKKIDVVVVGSVNAD